MSKSERWVWQASGEGVAFDGALGAVTGAQERELGPPGQLVGDDVGRTSLHNNPTRHAAAGLVTAPPQQLLHTTPVGFEVGQQDGDILRVSPVARRHPQLVEVVESVLAERPHQLVGLVRAQRTCSADKAD